MDPAVSLGGVDVLETQLGACTLLLLRAWIIHIHGLVSLARFLY